MVEFDDIILFGKVSKNELNQEDLVAFEKRLSEDKGFRSAYEKYLQIIGDIQQQQHYEDLMVLLNENYKAKNWSVVPEETEFRKAPYLVWILIVVGIIGAVILTYVITRSEFTDSTETEQVSEAVEQGENLQSEGGGETAGSGVAEPVEETESEEIVEEESPATDPNPTAFMISQNGYFLTQYTDVRDARFLRLRQNDTTEYKVEVVLSDATLDVAVLKMLSDDWERTNRLPYRLATTQAFPNTEIMAVGRSGDMRNENGTITSLDDNGAFEFYSVEIPDGVRFKGGPVISKNGNIVAIVTTNEAGEPRFVKSTHLVGMLARHADDPALSDYLPSGSNNLAARERPDQLNRIEPFVLEVIRFY